jgi:hypothetical protein
MQLYTVLQFYQGTESQLVRVVLGMPLLLLLLLQVHDGTYTPADQFVKDPDSLCSTVTWKDEEDRVIWVYRIQVRGWAVVCWPGVGLGNLQLCTANWWGGALAGLVFASLGVGPGRLEGDMMCSCVAWNLGRAG